MAAAGCVTAGWVYEGSGYEICLDGEEIEMGGRRAEEDVESPPDTPRPMIRLSETH